MFSACVGCTILLAALFVSTGHSIKCFECSSYTDPGCADLTVNDTSSKYLVDCPLREDRQMFCRKTTQTVLDEPKFTRITRSCGWVIHKANLSNCRQADTDFKMEKSCQCFTDACNSAPKTKLNGALPFAISSVVAVFYYYRF